MFSSLQYEGRRPYWMFAVSFAVQSIVLLVPFFLPHGHSVRVGLRGKAHEVIYYQPVAVELAQLVPVGDPRLPAPAEKPASKPAIKSEQSEGAVQGARDSQSAEAGRNSVLVDDGRWVLNEEPASFTMMNHEIHPAQPVYTPDPAILHGDVPDAARGQNLVIEVVIDDQGTIASATLLKGVELGVAPDIFETLKQWLFVPAKVNGVATASRRYLMFHLPS
jgi:hypothetical protein